jgi:hypothetical protein
LATSPPGGLPLHTRSLTISISRESESLWRARGDVIDLRKNGFVPSSYDIQPAGIIHSMNIEIAFDPQSLTMERISVDQPFVAIEASESTDGECCRDPAPRLLDFEGDRLDRDFTKRLSAHFGGPLGCSHLLTLFQLMASTSPHAARLEQERAARENTIMRIGEPFLRRSLFIDGHVGDDGCIDVAIQLADTHSRPLAGGPESFTQRLERSHEWKILARVERKRYQLESLSVNERERRFETLATAQWKSHDEFVSSLVGVPLIPGMAGRIFRLFDDSESRLPLRDALLQFAPGFIQIIAALMDDYFKERSAKERNPNSAGSDAAEPQMTSLGGNQNSCYMWRADSAITRAWAAAAEKSGS